MLHKASKKIYEFGQEKKSKYDIDQYDLYDGKAEVYLNGLTFVKNDAWRRKFAKRPKSAIQRRYKNIKV